MTIDFHAHPVPDAFRKWLPLLNIDVIADDGFPLPQWSKEAHLQFMDDAGIDYTVLSLPTPHIHHGDDDKSLQAAVEINDELAFRSLRDSCLYEYDGNCGRRSGVRKAVLRYCR